MTTIYRAANSTELFVGAHFAATSGEAEAYTDNPGFGGEVVFSVEVSASEVLRCDDIDELADALVELGLDVDADGWRDRGLHEVFAVVEHERAVRNALNASKYSWLRFDEPSIDKDEMSTTYRYLG